MKFKVKEFIVINRNQTDEETYKMLKYSKIKGFMNAEEWKKQRLKELKKEGKVWSK